MIRDPLCRRKMLVRSGQALAVSALGFPFLSLRAETPNPAAKFGAVVGDAFGKTAGEQILASGGNAIDAAVAAALAACVGSPHHCGVGGYGGHLMVSLAGGKGITCIDFNTAAAAAARPDMYPFDDKGEVKDAANRYGWLASGVPGTLAGLQMALDKFGTRSFREVVQPAIKLARDGSPLDPICATAIKNAATRLAKDPGSAKLYLAHGNFAQPGDLLQNPDLARLLSLLAERNSVESFYRGDVAQQIAAAFQKNGGIVTAADFANYRAREVKPLTWHGHGFTILSAPPTAGGITALETLSILEALNWSDRAPSPAKTHALLEALRLAWKDRLELIGDPEKADVPIERLLSKDHAAQLAAQADAAVQAKKAPELKIQTSVGPGTTNISAVDQSGNVIAMTLTHGGDFGAQVTVEGLGVTLGQGMFKFNPHPGHPNAPGSGKRPLHNMSPTLVFAPDQTTIAVGGAGGLMIPNALFAFLVACVLQKKSLADSLTAPRLHTIGTLEVTASDNYPPADLEYLTQAGFKIRTAPDAHLSAVSFNPTTTQFTSGMH